MSKQLVRLEDDLLERTALEFAAVYYEAGRSTGLKSKFKDAKSFAKHNFERFIPKVIEHFLDILANPTFDEDAKRMIWEAIQKRHNDPNLQQTTQLPDIDVKKLISLVDSGKVQASKANMNLIENQAKQQLETGDPILKKLGLN